MSTEPFGGAPNRNAGPDPNRDRTHTLRMKLERPLLAALLLTAALFAALASGGFSAADLNRNADVEIVDDSEALVDVDVLCHVIEHTNKRGK